MDIQEKLTPGEGDNGFGEFYDSVDTIIMENRMLKWIMKHDKPLPYKDKECFVYSTK